MVETRWRAGSRLVEILTYRRESSFPETRPKASILKYMIVYISQLCPLSCNGNILGELSGTAQLHAYCWLSYFANDVEGYVWSR